jgi:ATP/ADP translocase
MRAVVTTAGFAWRVVGWILAWVGRALGVRGIASSYEAFVESCSWLTGAILGPWLLMGAGLLLFAAIHWPGRRPSEIR